MVSGAVGSSNLVFFDATTVKSPRLTAEIHLQLDGTTHWKRQQMDRSQKLSSVIIDEES